MRRVHAPEHAARIFVGSFVDVPQFNIFELIKIMFLINFRPVLALRTMTGGNRRLHVIRGISNELIIGLTTERPHLFIVDVGWNPPRRRSPDIGP